MTGSTFKFFLLGDLPSKQPQDKTYRPPLQLRLVPDFKFTEKVKDDGELLCAIQNLKISTEEANYTPRVFPSLQSASQLAEITLLHRHRRKRTLHELSCDPFEHDKYSPASKSTPEPVLTRKYIFPPSSSSISNEFSNNEHSSSSSRSPTTRSSTCNLSKRTQNPSSSPNSSPQNNSTCFNPAILERFFRRIRDSPNWTTALLERKYSPFPELNLDYNEGWNRARCELYMSLGDERKALPHLEVGVEEKISIQEAFAGFSLRRQVEPLQWVEEELDGMFGFVFKGEGNGVCGWAREVGRWGVFGRRRLMSCCPRVNLNEDLEVWTDEIRKKVSAWRRVAVAAVKKEEEKGAKKKALGDKYEKPKSWPRTYKVKGSLTIVHDKERKSIKRVKVNRGKPRLVMNEEWRKRRREQEKRAGRWTDGTIRMSRLWKEFYWVLNVDDPSMNIWPGRIKEVHGNDIWGWKRQHDNPRFVRRFSESLLAL
jgi:hypothetical protein